MVDGSSKARSMCCIERNFRMVQIFVYFECIFRTQKFALRVAYIHTCNLVSSPGAGSWFNELLGLQGYFSVSFKMQNTRYFELSLCQIFAISPEVSHLASDCAISVQKEGTDRHDLPWDVIDYSTVSHHCHNKRVECVARLSHASQQLPSRCSRRLGI